jgi:hypothetical protein
MWFHSAFAFLLLRMGWDGVQAGDSASNQKVCCQHVLRLRIWKFAFLLPLSPFVHFLIQICCLPRLQLLNLNGDIKMHVVDAWVSLTEEDQQIKYWWSLHTGKFSWWMGSHHKELQGWDHGCKSCFHIRDAFSERSRKQLINLAFDPWIIRVEVETDVLLVHQALNLRWIRLR